MNINLYLTFCIVILYSFVASCKRTTEVSYYFSDDVQVIELTTNDLTSTLLIDDLVGISNIEVVDTLIVLISPNNDTLFTIFDFSGKHLSSFGQKGQGPNDLLNCRPTGQKEKVNENLFIWINDISNSSLKKINLSKSVSESRLVIEDNAATYPMSINVFKISDSITLCESMTRNNFSLIEYNHVSRKEISNSNIYLNPIENSFSFYKSIWRINKNKDIIIGAMHSINQLNLWNLGTGNKKSLIIEKPYLTHQVVNKKTGLENTTFFCDLEVTENYIYALYMDQDYNQSYEVPKEMTVFILDWNLSLLKSLTLKEYILDIAVDPNNKKLYGICEDDKIYVYDLEKI